MTLYSDLITDAYRELNVTAIGATPSTAQQTEALTRLNAFVGGVYGEEMGENLADWPVPLPQRTATIAANYPQLPYPMGLDGNLLGVPEPTSLSTTFALTPPKNSRLVFGGVTNTVFFPEAPDDGSRMAVVQGSGAGDSGVPGSILTLDGNGRQIVDPADTTAKNTVALTDPIAVNQWMYRADLGYWQLVSFSGLLTDTFPFPTDLDDLWVSMLAIRLAPRYNKAVRPETSATAVRMMKKLKARYRQAGTTVYKSGDIPATFQSYAANRWWW